MYKNRNENKNNSEGATSNPGVARITSAAVRLCTGDRARTTTCSCSAGHSTEVPASRRTTGSWRSSRTCRRSSSCAWTARCCWEAFPRWFPPPLRPRRHCKGQNTRVHYSDVGKLVRWKCGMYNCSRVTRIELVAVWIGRSGSEISRKNRQANYMGSQVDVDLVEL